MYVFFFTNYSFRSCLLDENTKSNSIVAKSKRRKTETGISAKYVESSLTQQTGLSQSRTSREAKKKKGNGRNAK
jgi:hypothetical protein